MSELTGLRAIVTGGASGIGLATVQLLASRGAMVADRAALEARQPLGRLVSADEVPAAIVYLASPGHGPVPRHRLRGL